MIFKFVTKLSVFDEHVLVTKIWWNISDGKETNAMLWIRKYICHNKKRKSLYKFMPVNISPQIIALNIH